MLIQDCKYFFARIISDIFMPPFFSLAAFTYLTCISYNKFFDGIFVYALVITATVIIPVIIFIIAKKIGKLIDRDASIREERTVPLVISICQMILFELILLKIDAPEIILIFLLVYIFTGLLVIVINKFYKISIHTINGAGVLTLFSFYSLGLTIGIAVILILLMWSRYYLKKHTLSQILFGLILGIILTYFLIILL